MELEFESPTATKIWKRASLFFQLLSFAILLAEIIDLCIPDRPESQTPHYFFLIAGRQLAEEELSKKATHTPFDTQKVKILWEKENFPYDGNKEVRYKLKMVFQNEQHQYFWFFYQDGSSSLQEIDLPTVQLLTRDQPAPASFHSFPN